MTASAFLSQLLNGLASASALFLAAAGLSIIFGVTRIVNFAHGSLYMLGAYTALGIAAWLDPSPLGFWLALLLAPLAVGAFGVLVERLVLRRIYRAPELQQLLATFALVLLVRDFALWMWGPEDMLGPRAPGLAGTVQLGVRPVPEYDLFLVLVGPAVLGVLWWLMQRTRWGLLVRAATEDREMAAALGVNQGLIFTSVFALGAFLAGLGGAINLPREPATLNMDLAMIAEVFVVVVVGGMGSLPGAYLAALLIAEAKSLCIGLGSVDIAGVPVSFSKLTLVVEFVIMAVVLILRPWGLLGRAPGRDTAPVAPGAAALTARRTAPVMLLVVIALLSMPQWADPYTLVLMGDVVVFSLFAASLHFLLGIGGLVSFGHAAFFGLGAYGAALFAKHLLPMEWALLAAPAVGAGFAAVYGWFCVRLSGVYLAMLTLAFAQITWSVVFQWDAVTGGSNGIVDVWPAPWMSSRAAYFLVTVTLGAAGVAMIWRIAGSPFGYALRAARDAPLRAEAIGIDVRRTQWIAFMLAGTAAALAGSLYAFSKGSISPDVMAIPRSVDGLIMVLLGGLQSLSGPLVGAATLTWLEDSVARNIAYWRAVLGGLLLALVLVFPDGITGGVRRLWARRQR